MSVGRAIVSSTTRTLILSINVWGAVKKKRRDKLVFPKSTVEVVISLQYSGEY